MTQDPALINTEYERRYMLELTRGKYTERGQYIGLD